MVLKYVAGTDTDVQWFHRLQLLLTATLYAPILIFYVRRAYHIWEKSRVVLYVGYTMVITSFAMSIVA